MIDVASPTVPATREEFGERADDRWRRLTRARVAQKAAMSKRQRAVGLEASDRRNLGRGGDQEPIEVDGSRVETEITPDQATRVRVTAPPWWLRAGEPLSEVESDPLFRSLRQVTSSRSTVLDIGAGTGRFALQLAPCVGRVIAVDECAENLAELHRHARALGLGNVSTVLGSWPDVPVEAADVVFCSYVVPLIEDAVPFLAGMTTAARYRCLVQLAAMHPDSAFDPFWQTFHDTPRLAGGTYLDLLLILRSQGLHPRVEVTEVPVSSRFSSLHEATAEIADYLVLPDTPSLLGELQEVLAGWLVSEENQLRPPFSAFPSAVISWTPS